MQYTLDNIEHAVSRADTGGTKATCVAAAVERYIRKEYSGADATKVRVGRGKPCLRSVRESPC